MNLLIKDLSKEKKGMECMTINSLQPIIQPIIHLTILNKIYGKNHLKNSLIPKISYHFLTNIKIKQVKN